MFRRCRVSAKTYLEPRRTSTMGPFWEIIIIYQLFNYQIIIFAKKISIVDVRLGSKYASESETKKKRENANAERRAFDTFEDFDDKNLPIY